MARFTNAFAPKDLGHCCWARLQQRFALAMRLQNTYQPQVYVGGGGSFSAKQRITPVGGDAFSLDKECEDRRNNALDTRRLNTPAVAQGGICGLVHHALLAVPTISHHACSPGDLLWLFLVSVEFITYLLLSLVLFGSWSKGRPLATRRFCRASLEFPFSCIRRLFKTDKGAGALGNAAHDNKYRIMPRCLQLAIQNKEQLSEMRAFRPSSFAFSCRLHLPGHIDPSLPTDTKESKEAAAEQ
ncbi:hypothetical protein K438DRAFT_2162550 [Mycena galopus ATCC 62051]|nr:hypothetical protein K438DRAFT_2162550 [Mycena galopus ATCC 62051]